jgi:hypothetical protein
VKENELDLKRTQLEEMQKRLTELKGNEKAQALELEKMLEKSETQSTAKGRRKNQENCQCKCYVI